MIPYLLRRAGGIVPVMLAVSLFAFGFVRLLPGDPARLVAGPEATLQDVESVRVGLGLDRPLAIQYLRFLGETVTGHFGRSIRTGQPVAVEIGTRFMPTLILSVCAMVWATVARRADRRDLRRGARALAGRRRHGARGVGHIVSGLLARAAADRSVQRAARLAADRRL